MLVASAPKPPGAAYDLSFPEELVFTVTYTGESALQFQLQQTLMHALYILSAYVCTC